MRDVPSFVGNGHYCYANVTAMLLGTIGEEVSPGRIEVLSGVSLGALWLEAADLYFFGCSAPDRGITRALDLLGIAVTESAAEDGAGPPLGELVDSLTRGPAILGPLDMGLLTYVPGRGRPNGVDHYVLAYESDGSEVLLHDPGGFPCVSLALDALVEAWRADKVSYRRGAFRWWRSPHRVSEPSDDEIVQRALTAFATIYQAAATPAPPVTITGGTAIRHLAERARRADLPPRLIGHLTGFALPVGARRALDYAAFFVDAVPALAATKRQQAGLFGRCQTTLVRSDWAGLAATLLRLADVEDECQALICTAAAPAQAAQPIH